MLREQSAGNYRVPLIVKLAGQTQAVWVDEPLETMRIQPLLELAMRGKPDLPQALATIRGLSRGPGQPDGGLARRTTESHNLRR